MPIESLTSTSFIQRCAACGARHTISLARGAQKTKRGSFALADGSSLELAIDGGQPATVRFDREHVGDLTNVSAAALAQLLNEALPGIAAREDFGGCLIESRSEGATSRVAVLGGSACDALGLRPSSGDAQTGRAPVLGLVLGDVREPNLIALRPCPCGAQEVLVRQFDVAPPDVAGSFLDEHRRAVNTLSEILKANGSSPPELRALHAREAAPPPDLVSGGLSGELVIDPQRSRPAVGGEE